MTTLYYAPGGGLGHLTRARAMIEMLGIADEAILVTESEFANDKRVVGDIRVARFSEHLTGHRLIVDTFPAGLFGELGTLRIEYVARYLRWEKYLASVGSVDTRIERAYVVEDLDEAHEAFIRERSPLIRCTPSPRVGVEMTAERTERACVLIIHSGPAEEIDELIAYARSVCDAEHIDAPILLCAPAAMHRRDVACVDEYPATSLAASAVRIFTAGGFNAMREFGGDARHRPLPFERKFDDQFRRVALTRRVSSAAVA